MFQLRQASRRELEAAHHGGQDEDPGYSGGEPDGGAEWTHRLWQEYSGASVHPRQTRKGEEARQHHRDSAEEDCSEQPGKKGLSGEGLDAWGTCRLPGVWTDDRNELVCPLD